ncbi:MAG: valine--pyruvate aminotransferase [Gammaproteobacteria bacterium]|jgi:valine--pyruvate aminotransferase
MEFSSFGRRFAGQSGISNLMQDLGEALHINPEMIFMGGGNPARIPEIETIFEAALKSIANDSKKRNLMLSAYMPPQGEPAFLKALAELLNHLHGWNVSDKNIAISNGSQAAFFSIFNMFGGDYPDGSHRQIQLPLAPEYVGYTDAGLSDDFFAATKPSIELLDNHQYKYHVDFDKLSIGERTAALCVSRPTNPTGNVLTNAEIHKLDQMARANDLPFIIDGAYGTPFPNIIFTDVEPLWNENIILMLSLSKLGLPALRSGIVVANEDIIEGFTRVNSIMNLSTGSAGQVMGMELIERGELMNLCNNIVQPYYKRRSAEVCAQFTDALQGTPFRIHKPEGAIFLWLWFADMPISSQELYQRLKARGVLIIPGESFFPGINEDWRHKQECIRVNYTANPSDVDQGVAIIAEEVKRAYNA